ncbi:hypothetical protein HK098_006629 [Nowakowskiella sp. JEL0407]|nr:hypothetical protein HK098_006629 [Nowakowskiella sp. JEL0407]
MSEISDITLYAFWRSGASYRLRTALNLKKIVPNKNVHIDILKNEQRSEEYLAVNPAGIVPVLIVNSNGQQHTLYQSPAIIEFLDELHPEINPLLPKSLIERQKARAIVNIIACDISPLQSLKCGRKAVGDEGFLEWAAFWIVEGFQVLEKLLPETSGKYCIGDIVTVADVFLVPQVYNALRCKIDMNRFPNIHKIYENLMKIDEFIQASPEMQPQANL